MKKRIIIYIASVLIIIGVVVSGVCIYQSNVEANKVKQAQELTDTTKSKGISYKGKDGVTALVLLQQNAKIVTSGTGENAFVTTINGVTANSKNQYWAFYINSKASMVGAGSYRTKNSDTISWKLESF